MPTDTFQSLPLEQRIGQFLFIGLPGAELDEVARSLIEEIRPGGVILFGRNVQSPEQVRRLLDGVRAMSPVAPLCGVDQEGGLVDRLRLIFPAMPSARAIRQHGDLAGTRTLGKITGETLRTLGFNINFAPVMSIITEERSQLSNGLYSRSFGRSPGEVLGYTTVYMRGLQGAGCIGCLKHFPGIGAGAVDSHIEMPMVPLSRDDLLAQDLAIAKQYEIEDAVVRAFNAGEDMLLICATPETIRRGYRALLAAARTGEISEKRMNGSLKRIAATKALAQPPLPLDMARFQQLANEIRELNARLEYRYPGESNVD